MVTRVCAYDRRVLKQLALNMEVKTELENLNIILRFRIPVFVPLTSTSHNVRTSVFTTGPYFFILTWRPLTGGLHEIDMALFTAVVWL